MLVKNYFGLYCTGSAATATTRASASARAPDRNIRIVGSRGQRLTARTIARRARRIDPEIAIVRG